MKIILYRLSAFAIWFYADCPVEELPTDNFEANRKAANQGYVLIGDYDRYLTARRDATANAE